MNYPFEFSESDLYDLSLTIANQYAKYSRLKVLNIFNGKLYCEVESITGLTTWDFSINFNDKGRLTGAYTVISDNLDSLIPDQYARDISNYISKLRTKITCPFCGEIHRIRLDTTLFNCAACSHELFVHDDYSVVDNTTEREKIRKAFLHVEKLSIKFAAVLFFVIAVLVLFSWIRSFRDIGYSSDELIGMNYLTVKGKFAERGFYNVKINPIDDLNISQIDQEDIVSTVLVNDKDHFEKKDKVQKNVPIIITYHSLKKVRLPISSKDAIGKNYEEIVNLLDAAGYTNITTKPEKDLTIGLFGREDAIKEMMVGDDSKAEQNTMYRIDTPIIVKYHKFKDR